MFVPQLKRDQGSIIELTEQSFARRGFVLRETEFVVGIAIYVGNDTLFYQSMQKVKRKHSLLERKFESFYVVVISCLLLLCLVMVGGAYCFKLYEPNQVAFEGQDSWGLAEAFDSFGNNVLLLSYTMPVSVYFGISFLRIL